MRDWGELIEGDFEAKIREFCFKFDFMTKYWIFWMEGLRIEIRFTRKMPKPPKTRNIIEFFCKTLKRLFKETEFPF